MSHWIGSDDCRCSELVRYALHNSWWHHTPSKTSYQFTFEEDQRQALVLPQHMIYIWQRGPRLHPNFFLDIIPWPTYQHYISLMTLPRLIRVVTYNKRSYSSLLRLPISSQIQNTQASSRPKSHQYFLIGSITMHVLLARSKRVSWQGRLKSHKVGLRLDPDQILRAHLSMPEIRLCMIVERYRTINNDYRSYLIHITIFDWYLYVDLHYNTIQTCQKGRQKDSMI